MTNVTLNRNVENVASTVPNGDDIIRRALMLVPAEKRGINRNAFPSSKGMNMPSDGLTRRISYCVDRRVTKE